MRKQDAPKKDRRRSIRLKNYDYSQAGLYFLTICVRNKHCLFGQVENGKMILNDAGKMIENEWLKIPDLFPNTNLEEYVVMPNHFHAILEIVNQNEKRLGDMVGAFQSITTVEYIRGVKKYGWKRFDRKLWQRNYWEHIIRGWNAYSNISNYIIENPSKWKNDQLHP